MRFIVRSLLLAVAVNIGVATADDNVQRELLEEVRRLSQQVDQLQREVEVLKQSNISRDGQAGVFLQQADPHAVVYEDLDAPAANTVAVDLSVDQSSSALVTSNSHVLSNPWWQNLQIWGFAAAGYYDTGPGGTRDNGSFEIKEATLFVEADIWENTSFFLELQTNRLGADDAKFVRTGEVYAHFRDVLTTDDSAVGLKIGRFDLPFGEEYLWQDAIDNPLITNSASYPYGWDEGVLAYGHWRELNWVAAVSDGTDKRSSDENSDKALNLKLYGDLTDALYISGSYMRNGDNTKSAIEFGGSHFEPVTDSAVGSSSSAEVGSSMLEIYAKYQFALASMPAYLSVTAGVAEQEDNDGAFDREFQWFTVEPFLQLNSHYYTVLRYSEIGTYDNNEGFHFDGKTFAGGNSAYGFDTERFRRVGVGLGWQPNPRTTAKIEIGKDWFDLIEGAMRNEDNNRNFVGVEMSVGF